MTSRYRYFPHDLGSVPSPGRAAMLCRIESLIEGRKRGHDYSAAEIAKRYKISEETARKYKKLLDRVFPVRNSQCA